MTMTRHPRRFGVSFLFMSTTAALLLTWTVWWAAVVGTSVPARRPFFRTQDQVPDLIQRSTDATVEDVFEYSLHGGWPAANSAVRLIASLLGIGASVSFSLIATIASEQKTRTTFSVILFLISLFGLLSFILDTVAIVRTASECRSGNCVTSVPDFVRLSSTICKCSVDGWFYLTVFVDLILCVAALSCLVLTISPLLRRHRDESNMTHRSNQ